MENYRQFQYFKINVFVVVDDRLCGPVGRIPGCRPRDPGSITGAKRFSEFAVGMEMCALSLVKINEDFERKSSGSGIETEIKVGGDPPR
jgi:hypothetical protein